MNILEIMKNRHSVRSFDGNPLSDEDKKRMENKGILHLPIPE